MDVHCRVCAEPWDRYGVNNGDMMNWERDLFQQGAGCPCCEGEPPEGRTDLLIDAVRATITGNGDPNTTDDLLAVVLKGRAKIAWEKPEPKIIIECENCNCRVVECPDDGEEYVESVLYDQPQDSTEFGSWCGQENVCLACQITCADCSAELVQAIDGNTHDNTPYYMDDDYYGRTPLCMDCFGNRCRHRQDLGDAYACEEELTDALDYPVSDDVSVSVESCEDYGTIEIHLSSNNGEVEFVLDWHNREKYLGGSGSHIDIPKIWAEVGVNLENMTIHWEKIDYPYAKVYSLHPPFDPIS